jgi:NADH-quinone oxidoreductase subunit L
VTTPLSSIPLVLAGAVGPETGEAAHALTAPVEVPLWIALIPALPMLGVVLAALCAILKVRTKLPAFLTVGCLGASFVLAVAAYLHLSGMAPGSSMVVTAFEWFRLSWGDGPGQTFHADFAFYIDTLTCLWMLFVTGLATLIALYASEYMSHDVGAGYCRFFVAFNLFVFSMACLVMGENLLVLFLGWEGVGLCSYLLIGYFYKKPSAVEAAKKAFIVNRIGDFGLLLGIFLTFVKFGTVRYPELWPMVQPYIDMVKSGHASDVPLTVGLIPVLLMIGAFGKSAQLPLYVWLPDAMEGPTPVSALIHAATMVTAGVYLIARTYPLFLVSEYALPIVAWIGALTALLSATIGMAQFDIKRIMAYSTVSQLGYMFCGLAVLSSAGAAYHVFTHAFFKATLFLCCGAVMHGFAGQLDLRKLSGVSFMKGWGIVGIAMLVGCLNLAGFPFTAGYFSKDMILAESFVTPGPGYQTIGWILLLTAGLTAYYTFRVFFRVFVGPQAYEPGDEAHDDHGHDGDHGADDAHGHRLEAGATGEHRPEAGAAHGFHPHAPGWAINTVLAVLALASILAAGAYFIDKDHHGWVGRMVHESSANYVGAAAFLDADAHAADGHDAAHGSFLGLDPHKAMYYVSSVVGLIGIGAAFYLHYLGRRTSETARADGLLPWMGPLARWAQRKWYVDEFYHAVIVLPVRVLAHVFHAFDRLIVDGLVNLAGLAPRLIGSRVRPWQNGQLHGYAAGMVAGVAMLIAAVVLLSL